MLIISVNIFFKSIDTIASGLKKDSYETDVSHVIFCNFRFIGDTTNKIASDHFSLQSTIWFLSLKIYIYPD